MNYEDFKNRANFSKEEVLALAYGNLFSDAPEGYNTRLPLPPMLMIDRIEHISRKGNKGRMVAERDVNVDDWFFQCHFLGDPVQPGCLGVDGVWQLLGLYCAWRGSLGSGRALGCSEVEFFGQIRPYDGVMRYDVRVVRYQDLVNSGSSVVIGDATVLIDDEPIYEIKRAKVGVFRDIDYPDYPRPTSRSKGGRMDSE
ncbi:MAG: bifunctional 3-hydroxydecanoyl-ACP dehydratase/trans-2-decenoyl-ACP isomerase [Longimicrobiales bacterium]|nr:bifunctional 3-hydroxydecanoyl-ACP dehydratase/trans-2-decenoyl-ACP isomerase [Longimicrobiales bacterium]